MRLDFLLKKFSLFVYECKEMGHSGPSFNFNFQKQWSSSSFMKDAFSTCSIFFVSIFLVFFLLLLFKHLLCKLRIFLDWIFLFFQELPKNSSTMIPWTSFIGITLYTSLLSTWIVLKGFTFPLLSLIVYVPGWPHSSKYSRCILIILFISYDITS